MSSKHDEHYQKMTIEPYEVMKSIGVFHSYCLGAAVKYILRAGWEAKESYTTNIDKAISVLQALRSHLDETG